MESYTDILREHEKSGCVLEIISFTTIFKEVESRQHGMYSVSMTGKDSKKCCKFYQCSECLCKDSTIRHFKQEETVARSNHNTQKLHSYLVLCSCMRNGRYK